MKRLKIPGIVILCAALLMLFLRVAGGLAPGADSVRARAVNLAGGSAYFVQLGAFDGEQAATEFAAPLTQRGAASVVFYDAVYRALGALYDSRADAEAAASRLRAAENMNASVYERAANPASVALESTKRAADALIALDAALPDALRSMASLAFEIDRGETDAARAAQKLRAILVPLRAAHAKLSGDCPEPARALLDLATGVLAETYPKDGDPLALSAAIKTVSVAGTLNWILWREGL